VISFRYPPPATKKTAPISFCDVIQAFGSSGNGRECVCSALMGPLESWKIVGKKSWLGIASEPAQWILYPTPA